MLYKPVVRKHRDRERKGVRNRDQFIEKFTTAETQSRLSYGNIGKQNEQENIMSILRRWADTKSLIDRRNFHEDRLY